MVVKRYLGMIVSSRTLNLTLLFGWKWLVAWKDPLNEYVHRNDGCLLVALLIFDRSSGVDTKEKHTYSGLSMNYTHYVSHVSH
jgi:hypothetical protein